MPNNKKYLSMLGLARRAGKLSMGHDMALKAIQSNKASLVVFASDISPRLITEFEIACKKADNEIQLIKLSETIDGIHNALGYKAGVITVNDYNFSSRITELINQEGNEYGN